MKDKDKVLIHGIIEEVKDVHAVSAIIATARLLAEDPERAQHISKAVQLVRNHAVSSRGVLHRLAWVLEI